VETRCVLHTWVLLRFLGACQTSYLWWPRAALGLCNAPFRLRLSLQLSGNVPAQLLLLPRLRVLQLSGNKFSGPVRRALPV